ncbi:recombinase-like helix-turn-helix domain-containing protein [Novosphingobium sp. 9U]|uniref:recombinase-like helix-turn-helix domain-containing protein n=1 Tax=Novosphingobium sp. 9U TaxID=2653158 RepID=UPI0012F31E98|nr:recombinase-like helix-turn-helix domain-containing protein [Novosphingobium sp. 9U]VWX54561.1 conserved hypothetical protein [Novosphingobium sp. 9U]
MRYNEFLAEGSDAKGGGRFIEDPRSVENYVFQTRGGPLASSEEALAQALTAAFQDGAIELAEVVAALNTGGSRDSAGAPWSEVTLDAELERLGGALFQIVSGEAA